MNQKLKQYITQERNRGTNDMVIENRLLSVGWQRQEIKHAMNVDEQQSDLNGTAVKIWCHICREKVEVLKPEIKSIQIKPNSYRNFLTGKCSICDKNVSGIVK